MARLLEGYIGRRKNQGDQSEKKPRTAEGWFEEAEETGEAQKATGGFEITSGELNRQADEKEQAKKASKNSKPDLHLVTAQEPVVIEPPVDKNTEKLLARKLEIEDRQAELQRQLQAVREELARINLALADGAENDDLTQVA